ncbi:nucleotidyltransferase domain-containing protein [Candidatus Sumerlaeota bacterium]|nr:nucleotidyltransferase domain-containing protein [Candidatus Sumerlaeota bacterium]
MDKKIALKNARNYVKHLISDRHYDIKEAFIFGSYARNSFNEDSDIDIAIILKGYKNSVQELSNLMRLRRDFDLRIEPHPIAEEDFNQNNPFAKEVKRGLKII